MSKYKLISSTNNPLISQITKFINHTNIYKKSNFIYVENFKLINELIINNHEIKYLLICENQIDKYKWFIHKHKIDNKRVFLINNNIAKKITTNSSCSDIFCLAIKPMINQFQVSNNENVVLIDNVQDPGNLGTIIRACFGLGINKIYLYNCVDLYNFKVIKSGMGACFKSSIYKIKQPVELINKYKSINYKVIATCLNKDSINLDNYNFNPVNNFLIFGNEGHGIDQSLINYCDIKLTLKMENNIESLNVSGFVNIICYLIKIKKINN